MASTDERASACGCCTYPRARRHTRLAHFLMARRNNVAKEGALIDMHSLVDTVTQIKKEQENQARLIERLLKGTARGAAATNPHSSESCTHSLVPPLGVFCLALLVLACYCYEPLRGLRTCCVVPVLSFLFQHLFALSCFVYWCFYRKDGKIAAVSDLYSEDKYGVVLNYATLCFMHMAQFFLYNVR